MTPRSRFHVDRALSAPTPCPTDEVCGSARRRRGARRGVWQRRRFVVRHRRTCDDPGLDGRDRVGIDRSRIDRPRIDRPGARRIPPRPTAASRPAALGDPTAFPVTFDTMFGETVIESKPERVVSVGYTEGDLILALGVTPVAIRDWYGDQPNGLWPWAAATPAAQAGDIEVIPSAEINFEQVAALNPDVIFAIGSGIDQEQFDTLSAIAPVVAQSDEYNDFGTPWDVAQVMIGKALGLEAEAQALVDDVNAPVRGGRRRPPGLAGPERHRVATISADGTIGAFTDGDNRGHLLTQLGFVIPRRDHRDRQRHVLRQHQRRADRAPRQRPAAVHRAGGRSRRSSAAPLPGPDVGARRSHGVRRRRPRRGDGLLRHAGPPLRARRPRPADRSRPRRVTARKSTFVTRNRRPGSPNSCHKRGLTGGMPEPRRFRRFRPS